MVVTKGGYVPYHRHQNSVLSVDEQGDKKLNVQLLAVGIGHDVTRNYKKAVKINN